MECQRTGLERGPDLANTSAHVHPRLCGYFMDRDGSPHMN